MARYSTGQIFGKLGEVKGHLAQGAKKRAACKAAGVSTAAYDRWAAAYRRTPLPTLVRPVSERGGFVFSQDGRRLVVLDLNDGALDLQWVETASGKELKRAAYAPPHEPDTWTTVVAASVDPTGQRALFLIDDGSLHLWDLERGAVERCRHSLPHQGLPLKDLPSSGANRWALAALSHDLALVAYWRQAGDQTYDLCLARVDDGAEVLRHRFEDLSMGSPLAFNPAAPILATYDSNSLITLFDTQKRKLLLKGGPQVHSVSFASADTMLADDWYGKTMEFNLRKGSTRVVAKGWGSQGSLGGRFINAEEAGIWLRSRRDRKRELLLPLEKSQRSLLSVDGSALAVQADVLCVWDLAALES